MPIEVGIWKITNEVTRVNFSTMESEKKLETVLQKELSIISEDLLLIGRQVRTDFGKFIDMLAMDQDGALFVIELKRGRTPREVVAQVLDYASWVQDLSYQEVITIFGEHNYLKNFDEAFIEKFGTSVPEEVNVKHEMIIVSSELDLETERIVNYLSSQYNVPINAVFFRYFKDGNEEFLTRSWLIDPTQLEERVSSSSSEGKREKWNGQDFVVNFEETAHRSWSDAVKYGFVSAGNGKWYSRTLGSLFEGARIFCMVPKNGYVGIGTVARKSVPIGDAQVTSEGQTKRLADCLLTAPEMLHDLADLDKCEYVVGIEWTKTVPISDAFWVKGLRANQNSAYRLTNQYTIDKVLEHFGVDTE